MSELNNPFNVLPDYDLPRQHTTCRILVHSHITDNDKGGVIDCTLDTIQCSTSKTIKGGGSATFVLVPRSNYMNYIFPNDWVNIYFNPGDGRGYIRTFFGFVDRIERSISVGGDGSANTRFTVNCTDFQKAFEKVNIYFNPHIADRKDFVGLYAGTKNIAGAQLRTKGIRVFGSPADMVMNLAHLLLGFSSQFSMPPKYPTVGAYVEGSKKMRQEWAKSVFSKGVQELIGEGTVTSWLEKLKFDADMMADLIRKGKGGEALDKLNAQKSSSSKLTDDEKSAMIDKATEIDSAKANTSGSKLIALQLLLDSYGLGDNFLQSEEVKLAVAVEASLAEGKGTLLDLLDFSFVEYAAIDGSIVSTPVWDQQGPLWSIMNSLSNDLVNELFCDLRPLGESYESDALAKGGYTTIPDEHGRMKSDVADNSPPVRFVPALIMREYPFSTVAEIDASKAKVLEQSVGYVKVGAIFAQEPGKWGRKTVKMQPPLNDMLKELNPSSTAYKHLDVAVISVRDIINENIGRGDADVCNLIELYSDGFMGKHMKFLAQDFQPLCTPVSIVRHGLRVRTYNTRFARFSSKISTQQGIDSAGTRSKLARWILMLDHWYQHNIEYLQGTMTTRAFPEIRVGYRLDIDERHESYYVEAVGHSWQYPEPMTTTFTLSRGQRNDPFPVYVHPELEAFSGDRSQSSRLGLFFKQTDPEAVLRSLSNLEEIDFNEASDGNTVDDPTYAWPWAASGKGFTISNANPDAEAVSKSSKTADEKAQIIEKKLDGKDESGVSKTGSTSKGIKK